MSILNYQNKTVLYGGNSYDGHKDIFYDDVHVFDWVRQQWEVAHVTGVSLPKRGHHTAIVVNDVVFFYWRGV